MFLLSKVHLLSFDEIAKITDLNKGTVQSNIRAVEQRLDKIIRHLLEKEIQVS
ncbi:hypothetical protein [Halobacillus litoralis]|uniref:hypothetical protein n=1 Tax=Halobacillus litoralis TaxID=45668 RepID=UPI003990B593